MKGSQKAILMAAAWGTAGLVASKLVNRVPAVAGNPLISAGVKIVGGVFLGTMKGTGVKAAGVGMATAGVSDLVNTYLPSVGGIGGGTALLQSAPAPVRTLSSNSGLRAA